MNSVATRTAYHAPLPGSGKGLPMSHLFQSHPLETEAAAGLSFFRGALDGAPCPILIISDTSAAQDVVYANNAFQQLSGYRARDIAALDWTSLFHSIPGESDPSALRALVQQGRPASATLCIHHKHGLDVWVNATVSPVASGFGFVTHYVLVLHDVTEERRSRQELEHRAYHDPLTGLANRHLLKDRFEQALARAHRHNSSFAVVLLDMNGFKLINDNYGHDAGDELLKCVGARLKECVRDEDTVARVGGDEFVLLLEETEPQSTEAVIRRVDRAIRQPVLIKGHQVTPAACAGAARYAVDGVTLEVLLKAADLELYRSKARTQPSRRGFFWPVQRAISA